MKNSILICTILVTLASVTPRHASAGQAANDLARNADGFSPEQQVLVDIEKAWAKAITARDVKVLDRIMADDFVDTGSLGSMSSKAEILQAMKSANAPPRQNRLRDITVRIYGDTAVVKGLNVAMDQEGNFLRRVRFTDTFIKRAGEWKAVAGHECVVVTP
jgi:ketosteroid isomerase-like protein